MVQTAISLEQIKSEIGSGALEQVRSESAMRPHGDGEAPRGEQTQPYLGLYGAGYYVISAEYTHPFWENKYLIDRNVYAYADQTERMKSMSTDRLIEWHDEISLALNAPLNKSLLLRLQSQIARELTARLGEGWCKGGVRQLS